MDWWKVGKYYCIISGAISGPYTAAVAHKLYKKGSIHRNDRLDDFLRGFTILFWGTIGAIVGPTVLPLSSLAILLDYIDESVEQKAD